jgi:hypothetical protein
MADLNVRVTDATGSKVNEVEIPDSVPVIRVIAALVKELKLPLAGPDGQPMSYRFHHVESQSQLRDDASLSSSSVQQGDTLRLVPEITAG